MVLFFLVTMALAPLKRLQKSVTEAEQQATGKMKTPNATGNDYEKEDEVQDFHQVAGVRFLKFKKNINSFTNRMAHIMFMVTAEPLRILTNHFLRCSWITDDMAGDRMGTPPVLDLLYERASICVEVLQYYSSCLAGDAERLWLVIGISGCSSLQQWMAAVVIVPLLLFTFVCKDDVLRAQRVMSTHHTHLATLSWYITLDTCGYAIHPSHKYCLTCSSSFSFPRPLLAPQPRDRPWSDERDADVASARLLTSGVRHAWFPGIGEPSWISCAARHGLNLSLCQRELVTVNLAAVDHHHHHQHSS